MSPPGQNFSTGVSIVKTAIKSYVTTSWVTTTSAILFSAIPDKKEGCKAAKRTVFALCTEAPPSS